MEIYPRHFLQFLFLFSIVFCQDEGNNLLNSSFPPLFFAPSSQNPVCANTGRFLGEYCLGDYNCDQGRPGSNKVCIRGLCCTKTRISKAIANKLRPEDGICRHRRSFNVGIRCNRNEDCLPKTRGNGYFSANARLQANFPLPLLECITSARQCCTSSRYRIPLATGQWCLNGGKALGRRTNGFGQCVAHEDCRTAQRPRAVCVDRQCCTPPIRRKGNGVAGLDDDDENGDDEFGLANDDENEENSNEFGVQDEHLREGRRICRRLGLPYLQVRRCSRRLVCGNPRRFRCVSTHCCLRRLPDDDDNNENAENFADENGWADNDEGGILPLITNGANDKNGEGIPAIGSYCVGTGRFHRFLGQFCTNRAECPRALDARRRTVPIRCIRGACCAALRRRQGQQIGGGRGNDEGNLNRGAADILPVRPAGTFAFCFDGTLISHRQCFSNLDCPFPGRQICVNNLCCPPTIDQTKYACGGLASAGQCMASTRASSTNGCRDNLHCIGQGVCCECRFGQPQPGVSDCRKGQKRCILGYSCDQSSGFCCPRCPNGEMPFGSCYLSKCASGFLCRPGNICCQMRRRQNGRNDLDWGDELDDNLFDDADWGFEGRRGRRNGRRGLAGTNRNNNWRRGTANAFWDDESVIDDDDNDNTWEDDYDYNNEFY